MDATQNYLLNLLLEIDDLCKKYDIEYMIDFGTTLGTIRHEGFIPWDDDIDINMTEENYYKFVEACKKELDPERRVYGDGRIDRDFPGIFGRYIDVESIRLASTFAFWKPIVGQCIDVFYMIELPGDPVKKQEMIDLYFAYDEYSNSSYRHFRSKNREQMRLYNEFCALEKKIGKEAVLERIESKIFHKHYDDCDTYISSSARKYGPSSLAPKSIYQTIYYADFEGHKLPISGQYAELLTHYYGDDWNIIPKEKKQHSKMSMTGIKCKEYVDDYMRLFDEKELKADRQKTKHIMVEEGFRTAEHLRKVYTKLAEFELLKIKRKIQKNNIDVKSLLVPGDKEKLAVLDDLFADYYTKQLDQSVRYWEVYFDIGDELFCAALFNMIYGRADFTKAAKLMKVRESAFVPMSEDIKAVWAVVEHARAIKCQMVYKNYDEAEALIEDGMEKYPHCKEIKIFNLEIAVVRGRLEQAEKFASQLLVEYPNNDRVIKAQGDIAYARGEYEKADAVYDRILKESPDGLLHLDIRKKREALK